MPNLGLKLPPCLPWILQIIVDGSLSSFFNCLNLPLFIIHENSCACLLKTFGKTLFWKCKNWAPKHENTSYVVKSLESDQVHLILKLNTLSLGISLRYIFLVSQDGSIYGAGSSWVFKTTIVHGSFPDVHIIRILDIYSWWFTSWMMMLRVFRSYVFVARFDLVHHPEHGQRVDIFC